MSKAAFGHSKSTIAMCDGSMERSLIPSGVSLKSASSIRVEMSPIRFLNNRESFIVALNKAGFAVPSFLLVVSANELSNIFFFFQAEDGIRDYKVTGVQTCALPI